MLWDEFAYRSSSRRAWCFSANTSHLAKASAWGLPKLKVHSLFLQEASLAPLPLGPWLINPACSGRTSVASKVLATFTRTQPWVDTPSSLDWSTRWCCLWTSPSDKRDRSLGDSVLLWEGILQNWVVLICPPCNPLDLRTINVLRDGKSSICFLPGNGAPDTIILLNSYYFLGSQLLLHHMKCLLFSLQLQKWFFARNRVKYVTAACYWGWGMALWAGCK